jgi:hypothetical protein
MKCWYNNESSLGNTLCLQAKFRGSDLAINVEYIMTNALWLKQVTPEEENVASAL